MENEEETTKTKRTSKEPVEIKPDPELKSIHGFMEKKTEDE